MSVPTPTEELEMEPCCACISSDPNRKKSKEFFANERNFVHWLHMGSHLGAIATLITAIAKKDTTSTRREVTMVSSSLMALLGALFVIYAIYMFALRRFTFKKREGSVDEPWGPLFLTIALCVSYTIILFTNVIEIA
eukprot:CAMPEP_0184306886 /NCGR_PEP_ID=MMETSP1049-20130417/15767_1 /TAXON_ID=77928 /ORGANISM="Proteomonas sulcata, Strain CCMP704" /LENGTH=136 /DNA_ID=CAMNT_0026619245 /DNA_START=53 /DNA_END=463 /DNA_ORIENTATION=+